MKKLLGSRRMESGIGAWLGRLAGVAAIALTLALTAERAEADGCIHTYGYWNGSEVVCTWNAGINCITCDS